MLLHTINTQNQKKSQNLTEPPIENQWVGEVDAYALRAIFNNAMSFKIISISENKPELPRIAVLRNQDTGKLIKMYLFPHIDEMASAIGVNDELTKLTDFAMLLATEDNDELGKWKEGAIVEFPF